MGVARALLIASALVLVCALGLASLGGSSGTPVAPPAPQVMSASTAGAPSEEGLVEGHSVFVVLDAGSAPSK